MEEHFPFSKNKKERFLELILFAHLATIYCDSILCEQEEVLTQKVIDELVNEGFEQQDIETKVAKIEQYMLNNMQEKTKDFLMIFKTSIKYALPPAETELYNRIAHVIMKGACIDDDYKEAERRLFQHFRNVVISINEEEQKKMDYGSFLKTKKYNQDKTDTSLPGTGIDKEKDIILAETGKETEKKPIYELSFIDDEIPRTPQMHHLHQYEGGIPDDVTKYEDDQLKIIDMV